MVGASWFDADALARRVEVKNGGELGGARRFLQEVEEAIRMRMIVRSIDQYRMSCVDAYCCCDSFHRAMVFAQLIP